MSARLDIESPLREGFLFKEGGHTKSWKKRYFALYPGLLVYYASFSKYKRDREKKTLQGKINEVQVVSSTVSIPFPPPRPCSFIVHTNDAGKLNKRSDYVLSALSTEDMNGWIACLAAQSSSETDTSAAAQSEQKPVITPVTEILPATEDEEDEGDEAEEEAEETSRMTLTSDEVKADELAALEAAEADDTVPEPAPPPPVYAKVKKKIGVNAVPYLRDSLLDSSDDEDDDKDEKTSKPKLKRGNQISVSEDEEAESTTTDDENERMNGETAAAAVAMSDSGTSSDPDAEEEEYKATAETEGKNVTQNLKEGILLKQGGRYKSWKHRFFRLTPGVLMYYKTKQETTLLSKVRISGAQITEPKGVTKKPYQFSIVTTNEWNKRSTYILAASSADEKTAWMEAFKKAASHSKRAEFGTYDQRIRDTSKPDMEQPRDDSFQRLRHKSMDERKLSSMIDKKKGKSPNKSPVTPVKSLGAKSPTPLGRRSPACEEKSFLGQVVQLRSTSGASSRSFSQMRMVSVEERDVDKKSSKVHLRALVSKDKKRFVSTDFDLDLTYVTNRLIAMGYPSEGAEAIYRNKLSDVQKFLETRHKGHYKIYNLCSERAYPASKFYNRVAYYPFDDHCAPPLIMITAFCKDLHSWLTMSNENVAVVHCKAGKGRTGVMLCAYLVHCAACESAEEALEYYSQARTYNGKGVTIPSQKRYVHYYEQVLKRGLRSTERKTRTLEHIRMMTVPDVDALGGCNPYYVIYENNEMKYSTKKSDQPVERQKGQKIVIISGSYPVSGDIQLQLWDYDRFSDDDLLCNFFFNTLFIEKNKVSFSRMEIDKACQKKRKEFSDDFRIELVFADDDNK
ncbi:uncharacterized protein [Oscarella lobularis]|uniref:uncharacterized protein n=1 Tax=Oscarella lobularis TaxID=121494 RepID=UPI00331434C4